MKPRLSNHPDLRQLRYAGGAGLLGRTTCWLGRDHLLIVEVGNFVERYRRFYFGDIHAVVLQPTKTGFWGNVLLWPAAMLMLAGPAWFLLEGSRTNWAGDEQVGVAVFGVLAVVLLAAALLNTVRGPTCTLQISTGVQTQKLRSLTRLRPAERFLNELTPLVQAAQTPAAGQPHLAPAEPVELPPESQTPPDAASAP